jgi:hypothetical protein
MCNLLIEENKAIGAAMFQSTKVAGLLLELAEDML